MSEPNKVPTKFTWKAIVKAMTKAITSSRLSRMAFAIQKFSAPRFMDN